jgi:hypothetical protein
MRDNPGRAAALATLALVALLGLVALGARSVPGTGERAFRIDPGFDIALIPRIVFTLLVLGGVVLGIAGLSSRRPRRPRSRGKRSSIIAPAVILTALFIVVLNLGRTLDLAGLDPVTVDTADTAPVSTTAEATGSGWGFALLGGAIVVALAALAVARRRPPSDETAIPSPSASLQTVLDEAISAIPDSDDPRLVVIKAYSRMEHALAEAGRPRRPSEAPRQYLDRVLGDLRVRPAAITGLTLLFEEARYSRHPMDPGMGRAAVAAMEAVQGDLMEHAP